MFEDHVSGQFHLKVFDEKHFGLLEWCWFVHPSAAVVPLT
jgi:hypothetical protein